SQGLLDTGLDLGGPMKEKATAPKPVDRAKPVIRCALCGRERNCKQTKAGNDRLPTGKQPWKRLPSGAPICSTCFRGRYRMLAVELPIMAVAPVDVPSAAGEEDTA